VSSSPASGGGSTGRTAYPAASRERHVAVSVVVPTIGRPELRDACLASRALSLVLEQARHDAVLVTDADYTTAPSVVRMEDLWLDPLERLETWEQLRDGQR
jgi:hypothetical protein